MSRVVELALEKFHNLERDLPDYLDSDDINDYLRKGYSVMEAEFILAAIESDPSLTET